MQPNGQYQQGVDDQRPVDDQPAPAGPEGDESQPEQPLTRAEFEALEQRLTNQIKRQTQSRTDQAADRLQRKFQELAGPYARAADVAVKKGLIQADQQQAYARALRDDAMDHAFSAETGPVAEQEPAADDTALSSVELEDVNQQGEALAQQLGLRAGDPELGNVIPDQTPEEFYASIRIAARLKAQRLAANPQAGAGQQAAQTRAAPSGRSPAAGAGGGRASGPQNPIANVESTEDLYNMAWKSMRQQGH